MSEQVTMWGNEYNIVPHKPDKKQSDAACKLCCFNTGTEHSKQYWAKGIYPCLDHKKIINKDCSVYSFRFDKATKP